MRKGLRNLLAVATTAMVVLLPATPEALRENFYKNTCPDVDSLIRGAVEAAFEQDQGIAPGLIRMHFHDCFVRGCDASVLLDGDDTEKTSPPNQSLRGFEVVDEAKAAVEAACPGIVSCADVLAYAARDSAVLAGDITWKVLGGRRDGSTSIASEPLTELPGPRSDAATLVEAFAKKGLTAEEMVALSGAHSIGRSHCVSFTNRLYEFNDTFDVDPTLSFAYASLLRDRCPSSSSADDNVTVFMDIVTPNTLDNRWYIGVQNNLGLLTSDAALMTNDTLVDFVHDNAENVNGWAIRFWRAMVAMGNIEVLEGSEGEIRANCRVVNSQSSGTSLRGGALLGGYGSGRASQ